MRKMKKCLLCGEQFDDVEIEYHKIACLAFKVEMLYLKDPNKPATEEEIAKCKAKAEEALAKYRRANRIWSGLNKKANLGKSIEWV